MKQHANSYKCYTNNMNFKSLLFCLTLLFFSCKNSTEKNEFETESTKLNIVYAKGFTITDEPLIGSQVYDPLCDYYVKNREHLKKSIQQQYLYG